MANGSHQVPFSKVQNGPGRSHAEYMEGESLVEMVHADLKATRISVDDCREIIQHLRDRDAPTCHRLENILAVKGQRTGDAANRAARIAAVMERKNALPESP